MDDHSRAVCGYYVFLTAPSAMNTGLALRQAIWHKSDQDWPMCRIPDELYVDHGSDFISHQLRTTAVDLRIELIHSTVARPQGRGKIERFFGSVNTELLPELPGHLAPGQRTPEPGLTLPQLSDRIGAFIISTYHQRTHPEIGTSPQQALAGRRLAAASARLPGGPRRAAADRGQARPATADPTYIPHLPEPRARAHPLDQVRPANPDSNMMCVNQGHAGKGTLGRAKCRNQPRRCEPDRPAATWYLERTARPGRAGGGPVRVVAAKRPTRSRHRRTPPGRPKRW